MSNMREVHPQEERLAGLGPPFDVVDSAVGNIVVDRSHALLGQRAGVADSVLTDPAEARGSNVAPSLSGRLAVHYTTRADRGPIRSLPATGPGRAPRTGFPVAEHQARSGRCGRPEIDAASTTCLSMPLACSRR